jgi:hypothetical protein
MEVLFPLAKHHQESSVSNADSPSTGPVSSPSSSNGPRLRSTTDCLFLTMLPRQLRDKSYEYLLVNPVLGQPEIGHGIYDSDGNWGVKYNLETTIIYTCKISQETLKILYGTNIFSIYCFFRKRDYWYWPLPAISPLHRYEREPREDAIPLLRNNVAMGRVRRWIVVVSTYLSFSEQAFASPLLAQFCKVVKTSLPQSIEVLVVPRNIEGVEGLTLGSFQDVITVLEKPLGLIQNIPPSSITFRDANKAELHPTFIDLQVNELNPGPWFLA